MRNLKNYFVCCVGLFIEYSCLVMTLPLQDLATNISNNAAAVYSSHARMDEEFNFDGRIVGGFVTSIANYPYQVSLQHHNAHICGGSIVAQNIILTAAHCIEQPWDTAAFRVRAGSSTHLYGGQLVDVRHIFKHEAYSPSTLDNDVALVVLNKNLIYTRTAQPVELVGWGEPLPDDEHELTVSGWGLTSETGLASPLLNYATVNLINQSRCSKNYQYIATISAKMLCAGSPQGGKDSCQGDSGGPLVSFESTKKGLLELQKNTMKPKQYGIVSWGVGCAEKSYPGVYANVAALRPWIDEHIRKAKYL